MDFGDEYTVVPVFFSGVVFQALLLSRSVAAAIGVSVIAALSLGSAWYLTRGEHDQILSLPFLALGIFVVVFACFYRERILPNISAALLLHYTILALYAAIVAWADEPVPAFVVGMLLLPAMVALYAGLAKRPPGRALKLFSYVLFLVLLTALITQQLSMETLKSIYDTQGFSLDLNIYIFVSGMVFLFFASNLLFLLLLIPLSDRRSLFERLLGSAEEASKEHRDVLISKMSSARLSGLAGVILFAHGLFLAANYAWQLVPPGVVTNVVVILVALLSPGAVSVDEAASA